MKRLIDSHLRAWKTSPRRKPLLLRGARQVGKTYSVRQFGKTFEHFVEINFELVPEAKTIFEKDLKPERILWELSLLANEKIMPGKTLLFLDELQAAPKTILALRYFYEHLPELHVIAAGSLIDFAIEQVGMPVGRVNMLYVYPLSFVEFLAATGHTHHVESLLHQQEFSKIIHDQLLDLLGQHFAIGGMPEAVRAWIETKDPRASYEVHQTLIETYRQDFPKYAKRHQLPYLETLFNQVPHLIGKQFKYSLVHGEYKKRELSPCLDLLASANVVHRIHHSSGQGLPLGAGVNLEKFKLIFLDTGLTLSLLGLDLSAWFLNPDRDLTNRGSIAEAFVGQELLAYASPKAKRDLYFWKRESKGSLAEVDYLYDFEGVVLPIEVKSGHGSTLRSMHRFLEDHPNSQGGMRFYAEMHHHDDTIRSLPLYSVISLGHSEQIQAAKCLLEKS